MSGLDEILDADPGPEPGYEAAVASTQLVIRKPVEPEVETVSGEVLNSASESRRRGGYSRILDPMSVRLLVERKPWLFEMGEDGVISIKRTCRMCKVEAKLRLEDDDGNVLNAVPIIALRWLQLWCCERCGAEEERAMAAKEGAQALAARVRLSGMPSAMAGEVSWSSMDETGETPDDAVKRVRAIEAAKRWAEKEHPDQALLLYAAPGTGKTRLAATAAKARMTNGYPIAWVSVAVLMAQLQAAWSDDDRKAALKVLTGKGPIVLDDLDKINPTPNVLAQLFTALDKRDQAKQRAVIITTNRKPTELSAMLGDVLMSRITGMCGTTGMLPFPGPDRRLRLGNEDAGE